MDVEPNTSVSIPSFLLQSGDDYIRQVQTLALLGKVAEAVSVNYARQFIEDGYNQATEILEQIDNRITHISRSSEEGLCFPFDMMDYTSRSALDTWRVFMGMGSSAEKELTDKIQLQSDEFVRKEQKLNRDVGELTKNISDNEEKLFQQLSELDKEKKARLAAQRAQRKLKAELESSSEEVGRLKSEVEETAERYDQKASEAGSLQKQIKQVQAELTKVRQDYKLQQTDAEKMVSKIEAMTATQEKLLAEKDGLHKRIEELSKMLENSSDYTK
ncbi:hypothetical protein [Photobacterium sp. J15]|uniref:hypothetical protein n=1 Tax=Photobacterium sp. J15 TaxID=265901 RepID=UPI0007E475EE|nr:hypothetical protein [Photobacterium sp. J15]